ncbi:MAG: hypothetical protein KDA78_21560, partial [Planctomycetaceae bacterium]|nr:hypothetical protein [Planctomycetaceae bacterium]
LGRSNISDAISNRATWLSRSWKAGLICTLATYAAITVVPVSPLAGSPIDITCRLRGWSELANRFESLTSSRFTNHSSPPVIITTAGRDITSALAFYLPGQPLVPFWSQDDAGIQCQYDLWEKPELNQIPAAIIVTEKNPTLPNSLSQQFNDWNSLGTIAVDLGGGRKREYEVLQASRSAEKLPTDKERMAEKPQQTIVQ